MPTEAEWLAELHRMANSNGVLLRKEAQLLNLVRGDVQSGERFINVFKGTLREILLLTSAAAYCVEFGAFSLKEKWVIRYSDLRDVRSTRSTAGRYVVDRVEFEVTNGRDRYFQVGFNYPEQYYEIEIAGSNADVIVEQIADVTKSTGSGSAAAAGDLFSFDPDGPEKAAAAAREAYGKARWGEALELSVTALDRLHDFYVFERFRNRQPSPKDAWIVDGYVASLGVTRHQLPNLDVRPLVRTATHRLRTIITSSREAGANPILFERALAETGRLAADVDVSNIFWE